MGIVEYFIMVAICEILLWVWIISSIRSGKSFDDLQIWLFTFIMLVPYLNVAIVIGKVGFHCIDLFAKWYYYKGQNNFSISTKIASIFKDKK